MWLFTKYGFFSAVCARQGSGDYNQPVDIERIVVGARVRAHMEALQQRFPDWLSQYGIESFAGTDYAFRIFLPKAVWSEVVAKLVDEMDYDNFKSEVARHLGQATANY